MSAEAPAPEDAARANFYALLARLFYAPPDRELLASLAAAGEIAAEDRTSPLAQAWKALTAAAAAADPEAAREEYEAVFVGTGKAEVTLYTGAYATRGPSHNLLVALRDFLAARRLERRSAVHEPEDHVAAVCDVMRHLVTRGDDAAQREFFEKFLWPVANPLCDAIARSGRVLFYRHVARFAHAFAALEHSAFKMD
jgi:TorA maturation chaperone TorD